MSVLHRCGGILSPLLCRVVQIQLHWRGLNCLFKVFPHHLNEIQVRTRPLQNLNVASFEPFRGGLGWVLRILLLHNPLCLNFRSQTDRLTYSESKIHGFISYSHVKNTVHLLSILWFYISGYDNKSGLSQVLRLGEYN